MIQVRCPGCGYLQSLSEERFLSIAEDFLHCPHCHEKVPKEWAPVGGGSVPEEERHRMLAFSRRILNGGEITREIVHALESQVRKYGPIPESAKALGIGYTHLGEKKKAEEFLVQARKEMPTDAEILHHLLDVLFSEEKYSEAAQVGQALVDALGLRADDEDIGRLALVYTELGKMDEAEKLLNEREPDARNSLVKQARRRVNKSSGIGILSLFGESNPLQRLFGSAGKEGLKSLTNRAGTFMGLSGRQPEKAMAGSEAAAEFRAGKAVMEYWIYTPETSIPQWEDIQSSLAELIPGKSERERAFDLLASLTDNNELSIDYILKTEGNELFDYPEELIPQNSRDFGEDDRKNLLDARMIVRLRLSVEHSSGIEYVFFMMHFAEAVRSVTTGVVQDAVSHTLWGTDQWKRCAAHPRRKIVEAHVRCELLDEGGIVWIHTHGMQKFGFPELEMEAIPKECAASARTLLMLVAEILVQARESRRGIQWPMPLAGTPVTLAMEALPKDDEDHFPIGSLKITPLCAGEESADPDALKRIFSEFQGKPASHASAARRSASPPTRPVSAPRKGPEKRELQEKILNAHRKAREDLPMFKKSFQQRRRTGGQVHAVKVGFPARGGTYEWMWVSLDAWRGKSLVGYLENTPVLRKDLSKGSRVQIGEGEIFDWVIASGGAIIQGAYTEKVV